MNLTPEFAVFAVSMFVLALCAAAFLSHTRLGQRIARFLDIHDDHTSNDQ